MKILNLAFFACLFCAGIVSCAYAQKQQEKTKEFRLPDVPVTLTAPEDRAAYLSLHYWDHFDFADTSLISRPEITEQAFVDFISILPHTPKAQESVDTLFRRALADREMLYHFISLGDKYLYEPNSPMHDEDLHILFLRALVNHPGLEETDRIRPRHLLEMALKNRSGRRGGGFHRCLPRRQQQTAFRHKGRLRARLFQRSGLRGLPPGEGIALPVPGCERPVGVRSPETPLRVRGGQDPRVGKGGISRRLDRRL